MSPRKMTTQSDIRLRLRAHHICCAPFMQRESDRGARSLQVKDKIKQILSSEPDSTVMVIEGVDELCKACPLCVDDRCQSPDGNEEEVRKWDAILLKELGLPFGETLEVRQWQSLIEEKWPFRLCQRCKWRGVCRASSAS